MYFYFTFFSSPHFSFSFPSPFVLSSFSFNTYHSVLTQASLYRWSPLGGRMEREINGAKPPTWVKRQSNHDCLSLEKQCGRIYLKAQNPASICLVLLYFRYSDRSINEHLNNIDREVWYIHPFIQVSFSFSQQGFMIFSVQSRTSVFNLFCYKWHYFITFISKCFLLICKNTNFTLLNLLLVLTTFYCIFLRIFFIDSPITWE